MLRRRRHGRPASGCPDRRHAAGSRSAATGTASTIDLHVVVEYGLNLAEVASTIRNRVAYEVERLTGLSVAAVEVHIDDVRRSG